LTKANNATNDMTTGYRANSYCIAVGFPHSLVTVNQAQKHFNKGALQRDFFRQMRFLLPGSGLEYAAKFNCHILSNMQINVLEYLRGKILLKANL
jgi:hypothetical protein